jgi:hypothetical protein
VLDLKAALSLYTADACTTKPSDFVFELGISADSSMAQIYTPKAHVTESEATKILDCVAATNDWISLVRTSVAVLTPYPIQ